MQSRLAATSKSKSKLKPMQQQMRDRKKEGSGPALASPCPACLPKSHFPVLSPTSHQMRYVPAGLTKPTRDSILYSQHIAGRHPQLDDNPQQLSLSNDGRPSSSLPVSIFSSPTTFSPGDYSPTTMRLFNGIALASFAGLASAGQAEVYILSKESTPSSSSSTTHVPRQVAKQIFAQRLGAEAQLAELHDVTDLDQALSHIAHFGKAPKPLFTSEAASSTEVAPSQLLVVFEGITDDNAKELKRQLKDQSATPAFTIPDAPSHQANQRLMDVDLTHFSKNCDIAAAINPYDSCWDASLAVKFDLKHVRTTRFPFLRHSLLSTD